MFLMVCLFHQVKKFFLIIYTKSTQLIIVLLYYRHLLQIVYMINYQIHPKKMKKYLVETYYTCTFKTVHSLDGAQ